MIALVIFILCCAPVLPHMLCKISDVWGDIFHIYSTMCALLDQPSKRRTPLLRYTEFTEYRKSLAFLFIFGETILSLSNVSKSSKQNIEGWHCLLLTETGLFEHPMLKWLFNSMIHRSSLVQSKCLNEASFILLGNNDVSFIGWTLVNIWQQMVLYPKRHVSFIT